MPGLLAAHNIVCLSTGFEGLGLVLVEGMMAGRIAVASRVSGCRDVIEDGVTGFLFAPGDAEDCARVFQKIRSRPDLAAITEKARQQALEKFSRQSMVGAFRKLMNI